LTLKLTWVFAAFLLSSCGVAYISPKVSEQAAGADVRIVPISGESTLIANRSTYRPKQLPAVFFQNAGTSGRGLRGPGVLPEPALAQQSRPSGIETRLPSALPETPYTIGIGDVLVLATRQSGSTVEELTGLLAAQNRRQGYTVQDDGSIAIPDVGRVAVASSTLEEAEAVLFERLVENQIDPTFSLEISEFNSKRVSVGGAVRNSIVQPIRLTPLYLTELLAAAGDVTVPDREFGIIRLYRDGTLYQLPLKDLPKHKIRLTSGDSVFVDTDYQLEQAQDFFREQISLNELRRTARRDAITELNTEVSLRRAALNESRQNYLSQVELDAVDRDYVYLAGEVKTQSRFPLPLNRQASLADALYEQGGALTEKANPSQIYVLRGSPNPADFGAVTAWHLNARNAGNVVLATRFELRPNDVIFVAEQPITRWNRVIAQFVPSLLTSAAAASN
jgi:polysaccharide export outer membrane protein